MHLVRFTQGIMREPAPVSSGLRELIASYTSYLNECEFCMKSHAAVSSERLGDDLVRNVLCDFESSSWEEREKALLRFAGKVTKDLLAITLADIDQLRAAGWNDEAIFHTITVCALFNFYNAGCLGCSCRFRMKAIGCTEKCWRKKDTTPNSGNNI